jgi:hypothetical protein
MARLFADENFPLPVVEALRRLGHDVLTLHEAGKAQQSIPDDIVLKMASADGRAILTLNRKHFVHLHAKQPSHAGIVVCTFDPDFKGQAQRIHDALKSPPQLTGQLVRVNRPTT